MKTITALIIGDEILSGKRQDKHFDAIVKLLSVRGLRLNKAHYLPDDRALLTDFLKKSFSTDEMVFSCGGIGNTPDDHTRQAVAVALNLPLKAHPEGLLILQERFGDDIHDARRQLVFFPEGAALIPNPVNRIPGFFCHQHYFVPGFPQMAHPMIAWVLENFYRNDFLPAGKSVDKALLLTGEKAYESYLLDLMEKIVADYPDLRLFSLPSLQDAHRRYLELGVEGAPERVDAALDYLRIEVEKRGIGWQWRDQETEKLLPTSLRNNNE